MSRKATHPDPSGSFDVLLSTGFQFEDAQVTELEGLIQNIISPLEFEVDGQIIAMDESTEYLNGTLEDLALDLHVEVRGFLNDDQVLVAVTIAFVEESSAS